MSDKDAIEVSVGITKKLGPNSYEFVRIDASLRKTFEDGEDRKVVWEDTWKEVKDQLEAQIIEVNENIG